MKSFRNPKEGNGLCFFPPCILIQQLDNIKLEYCASRGERGRKEDRKRTRETEGVGEGGLVPGENRKGDEKGMQRELEREKEREKPLQSAHPLLYILIRVIQECGFAD